MEAGKAVTVVVPRNDYEMGAMAVLFTALRALSILVLSLCAIGYEAVKECN